MTCWRAVWGPMVFEPQESREKKRWFSQSGGYPQDSKPSGLKPAGSMAMVSTKAHMHGGIDKQISRVLQRDLTGSMIYGSQPWGVDSGNSMFQVRCHRSSHIFSLHLLVHVCVDYIKLLILFSLDAPFFYSRFSFFSMAIFRPRKRIIGPLPHAAAGLEASLWRWYPRGARWANACSSGPMDWGVL